MRSVLIAITVSATCSLAAASNFCVSGNLQSGTSMQPTVQNDSTLNSVAFVSVPAPGTAALGIGGLIVVARRRRRA